MMSYIRLGAALCFIFIYGASILYLLDYDYKDMLKRPYLMFCFGSGGIASFMFLLGLLGIPFGLISNIAVCLMLFVAVILKILCRRGKKDLWALYDKWPARASEWKAEPGFYKKAICLILILIIFIHIFYVISSSLLEPETCRDAIARWGLKAKIFYSEKNIYIDYFRDPGYSFSHPYYPLLVPFEASNIYFFLGDANDRLVKILFATYFIMLIVAFYDLVRRYLPVQKALFFTALLVTIPVFLRGKGSANTCMADTPLAFYCFIAIVLFLSNPNKKMVAMSTGMILFFCAFTKLEGFYYSSIFILSYAIAIKVAEKTTSQKILFWHLMSATIVFILLYLPWSGFQTYFIELKHADFPASISFGYIISKIHRLPFIIQGLISECFKVKHWHIVWLLFFFSLWRIPKTNRFRKEIIFLLFSIIGFFVFYTSVYMLSSWGGSLQDSTCIKLTNITIQRLLLPLAPVVLLFSVLSFCTLFENKAE